MASWITLGTLRKDNENADVNLKGLDRDVAVAVDVVGHFFLMVRNAKNSGNSLISSPLQVLEPSGVCSLVRFEQAKES